MNTARSRRRVSSALTRRRSQIVAVALGALLVASGVAVVKPRDYRAETTLRISAANGIDSAQLAQRVEAITRQVTAPETLQGVAMRLGDDGPDADSLRAATDTAAVPGEGGAWHVTIGHTAADPALAARVLEFLAADYQWSTIQRPIEVQAQAVKQLEELVTTAQAALTEQTDELDRYVLENENYLEGPEQRLGVVRDQLRQVERVEIASFEGEITRLDELLAEEPEFITEDVETRDDDRIGELRREIRNVEAELTVLQVEQKRTDAHPAVVAKRKILMDLKGELSKVRSNVTTKTVEHANEMYASLVKAKIEAEADLARARRKLSVLRTKEAELLEEVRRAPDLRGERDRLAAAVTSAQEQLDEHQTMLAEAKTKLSALHDEHPLAFENLSPPLPPRRPAGPGTLAIAGLGLLCGAFLGVGFAFVADARDRSFHDATKVSSALGLPTLGAIDVIRTPHEERALATGRQRSMNIMLGIGLVACALLAFAVLGDAAPIQDLVRSMLP